MIPSPSELLGAVDRLRRARILVVGDLILDRYVWGAVNRISPEAPIQILNVQREEDRPGGSANVARNLAALGARVTAAGVVGRDDAADRLRRSLRADGISVGGIVADPDRPTSLKTRMIAHGQQVLRVDEERAEPVARPMERAFARRLERLARASDLVIAVDYNKGTLTEEICRRLIAAARRAGVPVTVGLKGRDAFKYRGATGGSLNRSEVLIVTGEPDLDRAAGRLRRQLEMKFLVVTLGERGMALFKEDGARVDLPAQARQVYDVTGAGDTSLAVLSLGVASSLPLEACAALANLAGGIVVGKVGTAVVTADEMRDTLSGRAPRRKVMAPDELLTHLEEARRRGRRIVFTNGCFDILHAGHVSILEFARGQGDLLVVGMNSDASVRRLKGPGRPITAERDRARVLAALECVDYVTTFSESTPERLIRKVKPHILIKGEDWKGRGVVGQEFVERNGGRVVLAPLVPGLSTTSVVERIRRSPR